MNPPFLDKSALRFPSQDHQIFLNHCGVSPLYPGAVEAAHAWDLAQMERGIGVFFELPDPVRELHAELGRLLDVPAADCSFVRNTAEALSMIANGIRLQPGDAIVSYVHEYPSNHYPWLLQKARGVELRLLRDVDPGGETALPEGRPRAWSLAELDRLLDGRTKIVAVSHVQFTSGFAADLKAAGALCRERGAFLVIDAAQSLGALELRPIEQHVDAVAASGWKWLLGPIGTGVLYTSPRLRDAMEYTMAGADLMQQGEDYLNHAWTPHGDGRRFEYSTAHMASARALATCLRDLFNHYGPAAIERENARLRARLLAGLDLARFRPVRFAAENSAGIQSFLTDEDPQLLMRAAAGRGLVISARGGYLRIAPHFYNTDAEIDRAVQILNAL